ncbi:putative phosphate acyltransferase [Pseudoloma neurophilia]|uniref:Putative phosphate acyltransferase n=1 Tax=Pseudoloma neurophilia TaxID=146866 RepID=A0A0R0M2H9_9MICR|nr:putative phosphate acyltransferase [Pseudoloma neurophilia]
MFNSKSKNNHPYTSPFSHKMRRFFLNDAVDLVGLGTRSINSDSFTKCFEPISQLEMDNSGILYIFSFMIRYFILLPLRIVFFIIGTLIFFGLFFLGCTISYFQKRKIFSFRNFSIKNTISNLFRRKSIQNKINMIKSAQSSKNITNPQVKTSSLGNLLIEKSFLFYCKIFCMSFGAIITHHGKKPSLNVPHIFIANHTSFLDFIVLSSYKYCHAIVAENHGGLFGFFLNKLLSKNGSLHFKRSEKNDKKLVLRKIEKHINLLQTPMLLFPEGTCVNNKYTVMFQKGVFQLNIVICPVIIKYKRKLFDPYWNRRKHTFTEHIFYLMSRWMIEVDVYWMDPISRKTNANQASKFNTVQNIAQDVAQDGKEKLAKEESVNEFIDRTKALISEKGGLINTNWNGYMKNQIIIKDIDILRQAYKETYLKHIVKENDTLKYGAEKKGATNKSSALKDDSIEISNKNRKDDKIESNAEKKYELRVSDSLEVQYFDSLEYSEFIDNLLQKYSILKFKNKSEPIDTFFIKEMRVKCNCKPKTSRTSTCREEMRKS